MPAPVVPVRHVHGDAPAAGPLAPFALDQDSVSLGVAGYGMVEVTRTGVRVIGPDEQARQGVWDRLGIWAEAQWHLHQGLFVARGCVIAKNSRCVAITGNSQQGASVTAALLTKSGWGLISDGIIVIDDRGQALMRAPIVTLDSMLVDRLFADSVIESTKAGRPRTRVGVPGHHDATLTDVVTIRVTNAIDDVVVTAPDANTQDHARLMPMRSVLRRPTPASVPHGVRNWIVARPIPLNEQMLARVLPPAVARALEAALDADPVHEQVRA